jgi:flagellar basal body-associated protein FliL
VEKQQPGKRMKTSNLIALGALILSSLVSVGGASIWAVKLMVEPMDGMVLEIKTLREDFNKANMTMPQRYVMRHEFDRHLDDHDKK